MEGISAIIVFIILVILCSVAVYYIRRRMSESDEQGNEPKAQDFEILE